MHVDYCYQYLISILLSLKTFFEKVFKQFLRQV